MNRMLIGLMLVITLLTGLTIQTAAAPAGKEYNLSANIPLNSYIYPFLDKLDGLGLLQPMQNGTKPYTRMQVAQWIQQLRTTVAQKPLPDYVEQLLNQLETEFRDELAILDGAPNINRIKVTDFAWTNSYYDGQTLTQHQTLSTYQPLNGNNNGYRWDEGGNTALSVGVTANLGESLVFNAVPRLGPDHDGDFAAGLDTGYLKTHLGNFQIQLGKAAMWWGPSERASLILSNNSEPFTTLKLSNLEPVEFKWLPFLGPSNATFFYSELGDDRTDVPNPSYIGIRTDFTPTANFTFALSFNSFLGGEGHEVSWDDLWDFLTQKNAMTATTDKWNTISGIDYRWRIPKLNGLQLYGAYYGEDAKDSPPLPYKPGWLWGLYYPKLTPDGSWDLRLEKSLTDQVWYRHMLYTDGYVHGNDIIGDPMGNNAFRNYVKLSHYLADGSQLAFHGEYTVMDRAAAYPQKLSSFWVTYQTQLPDPSWRLTTTLGFAKVDQLNYQSGRTGENYLGSIELQHQF